MENVSAFTTAAKRRIPSTMSVRSLDVGQLIAANVVQNSSLLSESVTYVSDLSDSSFSETLPPLPMRALPGVATVSLGEHLKMFPGTSTASGSRIMLASPTSPRLRSMCKECLSISKWAEYSMGWDPPGHVPWENRLDYATRKWLPEGSLFSSESFSRALFHSRNWRTVIGSDFSRLDDMKRGDLNSDMIEMMRELHNLRSYFAETLRDDHDLDFGLDSSLKPPVPALVVSTSYMTVPLISLDSQNLSPDSMSATASRGGGDPSPALTIQKEHTPCTISRPDIIPPSTLGRFVSDNHDGHAAIVEDPDNLTICVGDMISNLRLQCSNMSLSPSLLVDDTSWNSRSLMPVKQDRPNHSAAVNKQSSAQSSVHNKETPVAPTPNIADSRLKGKLHQVKVNYKKRTSTDLSSSQLPLIQKSSDPRAAQIGSSTPTRVIVQTVPRSIMAKSVGNRSQKPYKMVRFALPKSEVEEDLVGFTQPLSMRHSSPTTDISDGPGSKVISPNDMPKTIRLSNPVRTNSVSVRKCNGGVRISESLPLGHSKVRTRSVSIAPFHKIAPARESIDLKTPRTESAGIARVRRAHTLSTHPLSRIIKRPMLALKENKRATIAVDSAIFKTSKTDEKRRLSQATVQGNPKKSRIKSLLTRFK